MSNTPDTPETIELEATEATMAPAAPVKRSAEQVVESRAMVPAGAHQMAPIVSLQQQIEFAQAMAKAQFSIPASFRGNVGDCLAIVDIALRAGLSPYMLASKCYVEPKSGRLSLESQAYHALVQTPGILIGTLKHRFEGDGENLVCIVSGVLAAEPGEVKEHRSEPLAQARPAKNSDGVVKGSPLWTKKPRVQLFYDTSRDWVRIHAPRATLGLYTTEELIENQEATEARRQPTGEQLRERFDKADRSEGHNGDHVAAELQHVAADSATPIKKAAPEPEAEAETAPRSGRRRRHRAPVAKAEAKAKPAGKAATKTAAPAAAKPAVREPSTAKEYEEYAARWITKEADGDNAWARWEGEHELRLSLGVPVASSVEFVGLLQEKFPR